MHNKHYSSIMDHQFLKEWHCFPCDETIEYKKIWQLFYLYFETIIMGNLLGYAQCSRDVGNRLRNLDNHHNMTRTFIITNTTFSRHRRQDSNRDVCCLW